ncbi:MAG: hypothetical protein PVI30_16825 [Myxococcales bacterium]
MGRMMTRALEEAGLTDVVERALEGRGLDDADLARLREADALLVAGLADMVRERHRGDAVRVMTTEAARASGDLRRLELDAARADGPTGQEMLLQVALERLATPCDRGIGLGFEDVGLELAQTALAFGADCLYGDLGSRRTLPLLDGAAARRAEIEGLLQRAGRSVRWVEQTAPAPQHRSRS